MKYLAHAVALCLGAMVPVAQAQSYQTGLTDLTVQDEKKHRPLDGFIWYPTAENSGESRQHNNPVWAGIIAHKEAEPVPGKHPLVVLSHGMYGNAMNQSWLAAELAQHGFVVAAIHHPGTASWLRDPDDRRQLWERPKDISRVIDHFLADPYLSQRVDPDRIFVGGHSLGGFTAAALAGGRFDTDKINGFCADHVGELVCGILDQWQVAKTPEDIAQMEADLSDPRVKGFAIFDLGVTQSFSTASLGQISKPMLVFGAPVDVEGTGLNLDIESHAFVAALPKELVIYHEPATLSHFDFLGECTDKGYLVLAKEDPEDKFICIDGVAARKKDHEMIAQTVIAFFGAL